MKKFIICLTTLLSWVAFEPGHHRRRRHFPETTSIEIAVDDELTEHFLEQKIARKRFDVIPKKFRVRQVKLRSKCNYFSVKSRDVRDSNQKKIRRRINNT